MSPANPRPAEMVSVVILHEGAIADTVAGLHAVADLEFPADRLEVVLVEVGTLSGNQRRLRTAAPAATVVSLEHDPGRAEAFNRAAGACTGTSIAFLGAGHVPDRRWLQASLDILDRDLSVACVGTRVERSGGGAGGGDAWPPAVSFLGLPVPGQKGEQTVSGATVQEILYAPVEAMVVRADVFREIGGFDARYERGLDDVDFGWRLWLLGHRVVAAPEVAVTGPRFERATPSVREQFLRERNALFTIYKNYDDASLAAAMPAALALGIRRGVVLGGDRPVPTSSAPMDLSPGPAMTASPQLVASAHAIDAFLGSLSELAPVRKAIQDRRRRTDQEMFRLLRLPLGADVDDPRYRAAFAEAVASMGVRERFGSRRRIVVATCDTLTPAMAGPAIRAWQIASALSLEHDVELVTTSTATVTHPRFKVRSVDDRDLRELEEWCDVLLFQGWFLTGRPFLLESTKVIVADIYDPLHLEQLEQARDEGEKRRGELVSEAVGVLNEQLIRGDFFLCASEKQRDFWLGQLSALGRVNPLTYDEDGTLRSLIAVVPFGISDAPPARTRPALKGVLPGIGLDDKVILWGGGIYNWFDPLTLLHAVDRLRRRVPNVRLFFMGLKHPNPDIPEMRMAVSARALSDQLGLTGTHVFFNEGWVEYDDRQNYLIEADIGVSTHIDHVETAMSFRTRILDYLWASLPVVCTAGDSLADLVESHGLGLTVPSGDVDALEAALFRILDDEGFRKGCVENVAQVAPGLVWSQGLRPLVDFCRAPRRAPDLLDHDAAHHLRRDLAPGRRTLAGWQHDLRAGIDYLQWGGPRLVARKALGRVRRLLS
jgi:glycosyltransferase involved in cell wall biosynthesis/GT2 family glycosyltransferase